LLHGPIRRRTLFKAKRQEGEFRSRREEGRGNGVKNLKGATTFPNRLAENYNCITHIKWKRIKKENNVL
jgi:hypothetical protein